MSNRSQFCPSECTKLHKQNRLKLIFQQIKSTVISFAHATHAISIKKAIFPQDFEEISPIRQPGCKLLTASVLQTRICAHVYVFIHSGPCELREPQLYRVVYRHVLIRYLQQSLRVLPEGVKAEGANRHVLYHFFNGAVHTYQEFVLRGVDKQLMESHIQS